MHNYNHFFENPPLRTTVVLVTDSGGCCGGVHYNSFDSFDSVYGITLLSGAVYLPGILKVEVSCPIGTF